MKLHKVGNQDAYACGCMDQGHLCSWWLLLCGVRWCARDGGIVSRDARGNLLTLVL